MTIATAARNGWARAALIVFQISLVIGSALLLSETRLGQQIDYSLYDRQLAFSRQYFPQPVNIDPVIIGLDEAFVDSIEEPLSLSHTHLAQALEIISSSGARVIGVDIALPENASKPWSISLCQNSIFIVAYCRVC